MNSAPVNHAHSPVHIRSPRTWLLFGLPWPEDQGPMAEAACAVAPSTVPLEIVRPDVAVVFDLALRYSSERSLRVVFFSDLTRYLADMNLRWDDVGVEDWTQTLEAIRTMQILGLYLTISARAHAYACDASREGVIWHMLDGTIEHRPSEREDVRAAFQDRLAEDWPPFVDEAHAGGRLVRRGLGPPLASPACRL